MTTQVNNIDTVDNAGGFLTFLIKSLVIMANDPTNKKFYLPLFLKTLKIDGDKPLVPYETVINMGEVDYMKKDVSQTVCNSGWASLNNYDGAFASTTPILNIPSVTINGLNNARVIGYTIEAANEKMQYAILFNAKMNAYDAFDKLTFSPATFYFDVTCESNDKKHSQDINTDGTFDAKVAEATFNVVLLLTLNDDLTSSIEIPETYTIQETSQKISGINILFGSGSNGLIVDNIKLTDPGPIGKFEEPAIQQAFSNQQTIDNIQNLFNQKINNSDIRSSVASAVEEQFNKIINDLK